MDDTVPAAATNSAVFGENMSGMRLEPNDLTPRAESKSWPWPRIASFEAQAMGRVSEGRGKRKQARTARARERQITPPLLLAPRHPPISLSAQY